MSLKRRRFSANPVQKSSKLVPFSPQDQSDVPAYGGAFCCSRWDELVRTGCGKQNGSERSERTSLWSLPPTLGSPKAIPLSPQTLILQCPAFGWASQTGMDQAAPG